MSDLVPIVKEMYAAFGRGDVSAIMAHVADDVSWEFEGPEVLRFSGIRRGKQETLGFFFGIAEEHGNPDLRMQNFIVSGGSVAVFGRYAATMKRTGIRVDTPVAHLFQFRDGKVVRYVNLTDTAAYVAAMTLDTAAAAR